MTHNSWLYNSVILQLVIQHSDIIDIYCNTDILYYNTDILYFNTDILYYNTDILYYNTDILYYNTDILYYNTNIVFHYSCFTFCRIFSSLHVSGERKFIKM